MGTNVKQRDYTWDVLKLILIILVILGHWLQKNYENNLVNLVVYNIRSLFTIPLFVFISGYFFRKKERKRFQEEILYLFLTYFIVQLIYVVSSYFLQHESLSWRQIYIPNAAAWFLLSLTLWRLVFQVLPESWSESKWLFPLTIVVCLLAGFIPVEDELSLQRTLAFLPFFSCGYLLKRKIEFDKTPKWTKWLSAFVLALLFVVSFFLLNRNITFVTWCKYNYYTPPYFVITLLALRALFLITAFVLIFCILAIFPKVSRQTLLSRLGSDTMFYYVYHILVMRVGIIVIRLSLSFPFMLLYTLLSMSVLYFLGKVKFFRWILNPIPSIRK